MIRHFARTPQLAVWTLSLWAAINVLCWSNAIPFGEGPDEVAHFEVIAFEAEHGRIPEVGVDDVGAEIHYKAGGFPYAYHTYSAQPGLSYIISAALVRMMRSVDRVTAARLPGMLYAAVTVLCAAWGARVLLPLRRDVELLAAVIVAAWPQLTFVLAYANNDGYTVATATALLASWGEGVRSRWSVKSSAIAGVLAGLALLGKPNGFPAVALTVLLIVVTAGRRPMRRLMQPLAVFGAAMSAIAGWWYVIAYRRYGFDLFAEAKASAMAAAIGGRRISAESLGWGFFETLFRTSGEFPHSWLELTARSAVGLFSAMTLPLPEGIYIAISGLVLVAIGGWLFGRQPQLERSQRVTAFLLVMLMPALVLLSLWRSYSNDFQPQGRYIFPAIYGFAVFVAAGFVRAAGRSGRGKLLVAAVTGALLMMNVFALLMTIVPAYSETAFGWVSARGALLSLWMTLLAAVSVSSAAMLRSPTAASASDTVVRSGDPG